MFLKEIDAQVPEGLDVHIVMDNYVTCYCVFIRQRLESRSFVRQVAQVEQLTIGGAGRGCAADRPLR
jgi:hypothetical protein